MDEQGRKKPHSYCHAATVDLDEALFWVSDWVRWYFDCRGLPAPPFSGGTWDSWPAWAVDVWRICSQEEAAVRRWELEGG